MLPTFCATTLHHPPGGLKLHKCKRVGGRWRPYNGKWTSRSCSGKQSVYQSEENHVSTMTVCWLVSDNTELVKMQSWVIKWWMVTIEYSIISEHIYLRHWPVWKCSFVKYGHFIFGYKGKTLMFFCKMWLVYCVGIRAGHQARGL